MILRMFRGYLWFLCSQMVSQLLRGEAAANEDPSQGILLPCHGHGWADLQVAKGVEAGDGFKEGLSAHVAKVRALQEEKSL